MSCHATSHHITSRHVMSCHVSFIPCHVTSRHLMSWHVMLCHVMWCHVTSCHVMSLDAAVPRRLMPCHIMSCHVMWCRAVPCPVIKLRHVIVFYYYFPVDVHTHLEEDYIRLEVTLLPGQPQYCFDFGLKYHDTYTYPEHPVISREFSYCNC